MSRADSEFLAEPPAGSKIVFKRNEGVHGTFFIARGGRSLPDLIGIAVAVCWIALVAWASWNAVQAGGWLVLVCAPFWMVGVVVVHQILRSVTEEQKIVLHPDHLEIVKNSAVGTTREAIGYGDVEDVGMEKDIPLNPTATFRFMNRTRKDGAVKRAVPRLVIRYRARKVFVAEHVSESEMEWLSAALGQALQKRGRS